MRFASSRSSISFTTCSAVGPDARIHTHVQRPVRLKTKSSARLVEVQAAYAKVGQQTIHRCRLHVLGDPAEGLADQLTCGAWLPISSETHRAGPCQFQRLGIAIESDQPRQVPAPQNAFGMSRQAQRAVHVRPARAARGGNPIAS
jgi:hypothetical protein